jgi:hypothetical protein
MFLKYLHIFSSFYHFLVHVLHTIFLFFFPCLFSTYFVICFPLLFLLYSHISCSLFMYFFLNFLESSVEFNTRLTYVNKPHAFWLEKQPHSVGSRTPHRGNIWTEVRRLTDGLLLCVWEETRKKLSCWLPVLLKDLIQPNLLSLLLSRY